MRATVYLAIPLMFMLTIVQASMLPRFPILGLVPQLLLPVAVAWGLLAGVEEGALWAFWAGFFLDLFSASPMGLSSLAVLAAVTLVVSIQHLLPPSRYLIPLLLAALATLVYQLVYLVLLRLTGYPVNLQAAGELLPLALLHAVLMLPTYWLLDKVARLFWPSYHVEL